MKDELAAIHLPQVSLVARKYTLKMITKPEELRPA